MFTTFVRSKLKVESLSSVNAFAVQFRNYANLKPINFILNQDPFTTKERCNAALLLHFSTLSLVERLSSTRMRRWACFLLYNTRVRERGEINYTKKLIRLIGLRLFYWNVRWHLRISAMLLEECSCLNNYYI